LSLTEERLLQNYKHSDLRLSSETVITVTAVSVPRCYWVSLSQKHYAFDAEESSLTAST